MFWVVQFTKRASKECKALPKKITDTLQLLVKDIELTGPVRGDWPNYSKLSDGSHHCHLTHSYVVCWRVIDKKIQIVEVYYAGTRESAPY